MAIERIYPSNAAQAGLLHEATKPALDHVYDEIDQINTQKKVQAGSRQVTSGSSSFTYAITFPEPFTATPAVVVTCNSPAGGFGSVIVRATGLTPQGFTLVVSNNSPGEQAYYSWVAVGH